MGVIKELKKKDWEGSTGGRMSRKRKLNEEA